MLLHTWFDKTKVFNVFYEHYSNLCTGGGGDRVAIAEGKPRQRRHSHPAGSMTEIKPVSMCLVQLDHFRQVSGRQIP
jgi:hypothetical protein